MVERGHVVAIALVNSEREDVQAALLSQILKQTGNRWNPKVLMTDLAFAAFNAWKKQFPNLSWRFCNFHVWQAWSRKIDSLPQPQDMKPEDFKPYKHLIKGEIHSLLIRVDGMAEFDSRAERLRVLLLGWNMIDLAKELTRYLERKEHWAPPFRRKLVNEVFGIGSPIPMLVKSNNSLERFHGHLKWKILKGLPAPTLASFFTSWMSYLAIVKVNALKANIDLRILMTALNSGLEVSDLPVEAVMKVVSGFADELLTQSVTASNVESDDECSETSTVSSKSSDGEDEDGDVVDDEEDCQGIDAVSRAREINDENVIPAGQRVIAGQSLSSSLLSTDASVVQKGLTSCLRIDPHAAATVSMAATLGKLSGLVEGLLADIGSGRASYSADAMNSCTRSALKTCKVFEALRTCDQVAPHVLGEVVLQPFKKQRQNFGPAQDMAAADEIITSNVVAASLKHMTKERKSRKGIHDDDADEKYEEISSKLLADAAFLERARINSVVAVNEHFPILQRALEKNRADRIHHFAKLLGLNPPKSQAKRDRIHSIVRHIWDLLKFCQTDMIKKLEECVADVGKVEKELLRTDIPVGSLVLIAANARDAQGDACLTECDEVVGWVLRTTAIDKIAIRLDKMKWGKLEERLKKVDDLK